MKAILISIKRKHCANIKSGKKREEIRKNRVADSLPIRVFIYECGGIGVIGEFTCTGMVRFTDPSEGLLESSCLTRKEIKDYIGTAACAYAWHISDLKIYDEPKPLNTFSKFGFGRFVPVNRPPQSWMYVESEGTE